MPSRRACAGCWPGHRQPPAPERTPSGTQSQEEWARKRRNCVPDGRHDSLREPSRQVAPDHRLRGITKLLEQSIHVGSRDEPRITKPADESVTVAQEKEEGNEQHGDGDEEAGERADQAPTVLKAQPDRAKCSRRDRSCPG